MDERTEYGKQHEQEVLKIFDQMVSEFGGSSTQTAQTVLEAEAEKQAPVTKNTVVVKISEEKAASKEARAAELAYLEALRHEQTEVRYGEAAAEKEPAQPAPAVDLFALSAAAPASIPEEEEPEEGAEVAAASLQTDETEKYEEAREYEESEESEEYEDSEDTEEEEDEDEEMEERPRKKKKKKKRHIFLWILLFLFLCGIAAAAVGGIYVLKYVKAEVADLPEIDPNNIYELLSENSVMYDAEGNFMENIYSGSEIRSNISYDDLPENLINAFVCTEDKTFFEHSGFNFVRIVGAVFYKVTGKADRISGTSTITQQLARNLYLTDIRSERSMSRKLAEAYYTIQIEKTLSKEQILEAYLNTINLGFNCNGVAAAAQAYFSKEVEDLDLMECALLATLPKSPSNYSPMRRVATSSVTDRSELDIITEDADWIIYYNDTAESRVSLVLYNMHEQGKLTDSEYDEACEENLRDYMNPGLTAETKSETTSYFADYVIDCVVEDLMEEYDYTEDEARDKLYNGGLTINTTLNPTIQAIMEEEYANLNNFPSVGSYSKDDNGNILSDEGKILLYDKEDLFDEDESFILQQDEYEWQKDGSLVLYAGNKLAFYKTGSGDNVSYTMTMKDMYEFDQVETGEEGETKEVLFSQSGTIGIAASYKSKDENGNLVISSQYFKDYPKHFVKETDGTVRVSSEICTLAQRIMQPQSAMAIVDYSTGYIVGMVGGRGIEGNLLYNRATSPRQPGSSMKPLAVYSVALQEGVDGLGNFTAATAIDDIPIVTSESAWPKNWYSGYRGITNLRNAVEQSINACSVNLFNELDMNRSIEQLQKMGITSLSLEGSVTDTNASALALGGMTHGVSPLEMASAYGTFGNYGVHNASTPYSTVTNKRGDVILSKETPDGTRVMDESVASLMTDILHTVVTHGLGSQARLDSQASAGKTGTTSDRYDIWFCGLTPKYAAATWIGNDVNISLDSGSGAATKLWAAVMERVGALDEKAEFEMKGEFVTATVDKYSGLLPTDDSKNDPRGDALLSEIFIKGTVPTKADTSHMKVRVCRETGYLATPDCTDVVEKICVQRPGGRSWEGILNDTGYTKLTVSSMPDAVYDVPEYYCPVHNSDPETYQISQIYLDGLQTYKDMVYEELEPEWLVNDLGEYVDSFGNIAVLGEDGKPMTDEEGRVIVYGPDGKFAVALEDGYLKTIDSEEPAGEIFTDTEGRRYYYDENGMIVFIEEIPDPSQTEEEGSSESGSEAENTNPAGWPALPEGQHYVLDDKGEVVIDLMTGQPVIQYDDQEN